MKTRKEYNNEGDDDINCKWRAWNGSQKLVKGLKELEIGERIETIQTTSLLRSARIPRRVLETWGDLLSLQLQWKPSANASVKNYLEGVPSTPQHYFPYLWVLFQWLQVQFVSTSRSYTIFLRLYCKIKNKNVFAKLIEWKENYLHVK